MTLRNKIWCFWNGYCTRHAIKKYAEEWCGGSKCLTCEAEDAIAKRQRDTEAERIAETIRRGNA